MLMAKCLVFASLDPNSPVPEEPSALSFLRNALTNPNPGVALTAMLGLSPVLTTSDTATIVGIASTHEDLALPAVIALSTSCTVEAQVGIASIRSAYTGRLRNDIDTYMAQPAVQDQPDVCSGKKTRIPQSVIAIAMDLPPVTKFRPQSSNLAQVRSALDSPDPKRSLQALLDLLCNAENADAVGEMRRAWRERDSPGATGAVRDPVVQAVIARCLIEVDSRTASERAEITDATNLLRSALRSDDVMGVVAAVQGLAIISADQDVPRIAEVALRMPGMLNTTVRILGFTCGGSNLKTIAAIRRGATTQKLRDQIDSVYGHVEPVRKEKCGDSRIKTSAVTTSTVWRQYHVERPAGRSNHVSGTITRGEIGR
jgi:hypothetical protein